MICGVGEKLINKVRSLYVDNEASVGGVNREESELFNTDCKVRQECVLF